MKTGRMFTAKEITSAAQAALKGEDLTYVEHPAIAREALDFDERYAQETFCASGPMDLDSAYGDIWDFLDEFVQDYVSHSLQ